METPDFWNSVYVPFKYCQDFIKFNNARFGEEDYGCKNRTNINREYSRITGILFEKGCDSFISSGLPAHPLVLEIISKLNPKLTTIPSNVNAIENGWDFEDKIIKYIPKENILVKNTISDIPEYEIIKLR